MKPLLVNRNEVWQGPAPRVLRTLRNFKSAHVNLYLPGYYQSALIPKLAEIFALPAEQIIISYGAEDFLRTIFDNLEPGQDTVLTHQFHYNYYRQYLAFKGVELRQFKMKTADGKFVFAINDALEKCRRWQPKILLLASPNNPTGNSLSAPELKQILQNTPAETLVVVDEAYWGFDQNYDQSAFLGLVRRYGNLVLVRSFSKLYALAGLRLGFVLAGARVKKLLRYQNRYLGLSRILEEAALAALASENYYRRLAGAIIADRERFLKAAGRLKNFKPAASQANFVLLRLASRRLAAQVQTARPQAEVQSGRWVGKRWLRVTIGFRPHTEKFLKFLQRIDNRN